MASSEHFEVAMRVVLDQNQLTQQANASQAQQQGTSQPTGPSITQLQGNKLLSALTGAAAGKGLGTVGEIAAVAGGIKLADMMKGGSGNKTIESTLKDLLGDRFKSKWTPGDLIRLAAKRNDESWKETINRIMSPDFGKKTELKNDPLFQNRFSSLRQGEGQQFLQKVLGKKLTGRSLIGESKGITGKLGKIASDMGMSRVGSFLTNLSSGAGMMGVFSLMTAGLWGVVHGMEKLNNHFQKWNPAIASSNLVREQSSIRRDVALGRVFSPFVSRWNSMWSEFNDNVAGTANRIADAMGSWGIPMYQGSSARLTWEDNIRTDTANINSTIERSTRKKSTDIDYSEKNEEVQRSIEQIRQLIAYSVFNPKPLNALQSNVYNQFLVGNM